MTTGVEEILDITKGYLKDAWNLAGALIKEPALAFSDISKGLSIAPKTDADYPMMKNILTFGGLGATIGGLFILGNAFTGAVGLGATFLGLGRYHAIGVEERLKITAEIGEAIGEDSPVRDADELVGREDFTPPRATGTKDGPHVGL